MRLPASLVPLACAALSLGMVNSEVHAQASEWVWLSGSTTLSCGSVYGCGQPGVYGTQGTGAAGNLPGSREASATWTDASGNLWLFGGTGYDTGGTAGFLNDIWQFSPSSQLWTWMGGNSTLPCNTNCGHAGVYGTLGKSDSGNIPGGRSGAASWTDSSGNFWLFGGNGFDSAGAAGPLSDLWQFRPSTQLWTWMGGSDKQGQAGVYGTVGVSSAGSTPGARNAPSSWVDSHGHFWLFGGVGLDSLGQQGPLNDLWEFTPSAGQWTWISGSKQLNCSLAGCAQLGVYGTLGTPAPGNTPGGRYMAAAWTDTNGNLWLFGGFDPDRNGGYFNDLWEFNPSSGEWAWIAGSDTLGLAAPPGVYGTLGTPAAGNVPGGRSSPATWTSTDGNLWLLGGHVSQPGTSQSTEQNDLWEFSPSVALWTWMGGNSSLTCTGNNFGCGDPGVPGTMGDPSPSNFPGSRSAAASWRTPDGNLWIFGGQGFDQAASGSYILNDFWEWGIPAASPAFSLPSGTYSGTQSVTLTGPVGASIYYTTDGSIPSVRSALYQSPISITRTTTIQATAVAAGYLNSPVSAATYTIPATFALSSGGSLTLNRGAQTGNTLIIAVTPSGGFTGTVTFACAVSSSMTNITDPPTCAVSPGTVGITGTSTQSVTLGVATTGAMSMLRGPGGGMFAPTCGVLLALLCIFRFPRRRRRAWALFSLLMLVVAIGASGCGGHTMNSGGVGHGSGGTTAGNYTITVRAVSGPTSQKTTISLTVN